MKRLKILTKDLGILVGISVLILVIMLYKSRVFVKEIDSKQTVLNTSSYSTPVANYIHINPYKDRQFEITYRVTLPVEDSSATIEELQEAVAYYLEITKSLSSKNHFIEYGNSELWPDSLIIKQIYPK